MVGHVVKSLKKGERIRIGGLGILQVRKRAARMGRNPATGEQIKIKASKKVAFRAAKELKEAVRGFLRSDRSAARPTSRRCTVTAHCRYRSRFLANALPDPVFR